MVMVTSPEYCVTSLRYLHSTRWIVEVFQRAFVAGKLAMAFDFRWAGRIEAQAPVGNVAVVANPVH